MADTIIEAPLVLTLKCSDDRDSPWLVLRATDIQQLQSMLHEIENGSIAVDIGRVAGTFQAQARIGARLEAKPLDPAVDGGSFDNVKAAGTVPTAVPAETPPAATAPTAVEAPKLPAFKGFGAAKPAATPPATPPPATSTRPAAEAPPAALAKDGFPQAPVWKKQ